MTPNPPAQAVPVMAGRAPLSNGNPPPFPEQRPPTARLMIEVDGKLVNQYVLNKPLMTIGRLSSNDIQVPSQRVSRLHAKIRAINGAWLIEDAESLNGLVYLGHRVDHLLLNPGDRIHLAPTVVLLYQTA